MHDTQLTVAGRRGHRAVCRAVVACTLALATTQRPHTAARRAVVKAQSSATLSIVQVQNGMLGRGSRCVFVCVCVCFSVSFSLAVCVYACLTK